MAGSGRQDREPKDAEARAEEKRKKQDKKAESPVVPGSARPSGGKKR